MGVSHVDDVTAVDVVVERLLDQVLRLVASQLAHPVNKAFSEFRLFLLVLVR